jgi:DNA-directed RNA polymerase specialized sigma24 family protein
MTALLSPGGSPVPDAVLMQRLAHRDAAALQELERRYGISLYAVVYGMVMDPARADDIVAQTFAYMWQTSIIFDTRRGGPWNLLRRMARDLVHRELGRRPLPPIGRLT